MSAHAIPVLSLVLAFAATAALAWAAAGRRRGLAAIATGLTGVQGALHLIFSAGEHGGPPAHTDTMGSMASMAMGSMGHLAGTGRMAGMEHMAGMDHVGGAPGMGSMNSMNSMASIDSMDSMAGMGALDHLVAMGAGSGAGMLLAHLLAALACGLWLARGEAALFTLARAVAAAAFTPLRLALAAERLPAVLAPVPPVLRPVRTAPYTRRLRGVVLAHTVSRRGPPGPVFPRTTALGARV
ncbi:hypothetical protein [Streptomyces sp. NPDC048659]|uniref:hypothetical protein n=1 Tax=Streptomyces sp. NPDC048659 TaxID=3155489 RepID=UPI00342BA2BA